ncbi:MAG: galactosyldiacylglycerol synthase [Clostridia bacterium]|nr:galactosyldiacylglycerol synthase [Clostridia bacterium]
MKVLILSVTAGNGHNAAAGAIADMLKKQGVECKIDDTFLRINKMLYTVIAKGYLLLSSDFKHIYGSSYYRLEKRKGNSYAPSFTRFYYRFLIKRIYRAIQDYDPDVIVSTHCFPATMLDIIKEKKGLRAKTVGIVTDFVMHPFWEECLRLDKLVIANELLIPAAMRKGFNREQILPIGIPINSKFKNRTPKQEARRQLGLDPEKDTLLIMSGSMGYGHITRTLEELDRQPKDYQNIVVCGNNREAKEAIGKKVWKKTILNLGFVSNVELLMDAADCIVSKPGGLTTSEALAKELPMIIFDPIAGQEERNVEFLQNCGAAMAISGAYSLSDAIYQFFHFPKLIESMHQSISYIRKPDSTEDLCRAILSLCGEEQTKS